MEEITKIFFQFVQKHPFLFISNVFYSILYPINDIYLPHLYGKVMTAIENKTDFIRPFLIVIILMIILQIGYTASDWSDSKVFPKIQAFIRESMLKKIFENYETYYKDLLMGELMSKIINIPHYFTDKYDRMKSYVIPSAISFVLAALYFLYNDPYLGGIMLFLVIVFLFFVVGAPYLCKKESQERQQKENELHEQIDDVLRNLMAVYGGNQTKYELERLDQYEDVYTKSFEKLMFCLFKTRAFVTPFIIVFLVLFMLRCNARFKTNHLTSGKFVSLFVVLLYMLSSMIDLIDQMRETVFDEGVITSFEDTFQYIVPQRPTTMMLENPEDTEGILVYKMSYSQTIFRPIFKDFSLHIKPGEKVAIIGDIGSGKSTLLKLLLKLYEPDEGEIFMNGVPYSVLDTKALRKKIGYVPQQPILFNRTVLENIKYGNDASDEEVENLLKSLGIYHEFESLEHGIRTDIGKNGSKISGGQKQIVWCLRILLNNPEVLLLDEPTASLDEKTKTLMKSLFDKFMQNRTVIMVTHDPSLMKYAERIVYLKKGQVILDETKK